MNPQQTNHGQPHVFLNKYGIMINWNIKTMLRNKNIDLQK